MVSVGTMDVGATDVDGASVVSVGTIVVEVTLGTAVVPVGALVGA